MHLTNLKPVAHTLHRMNNDYEMRVPRWFQILAVTGVVIAALSIVSMLNAASSLGTAGIVIGIVLVLPALVTRFVTRAAHERRFRVRDGIVAHAELKGDEEVLDIGTGSGITLFGCAKRLTTGKGIGIDIYDPNAGGGSSKIFWKNAKQEGVSEKVDLKVMDARKMSFVDASFDVIVSTFAFHHIGGSESRRQAAQEIVRVLKPGGRVMVYDAGMALNELEQVMREGGLNVHRHGERFSMVMGSKP